MKNKNKILKNGPVLMLFLSLLACGKGEKQPGFITFDMTASYPEKEIHLQDIARVEYIPLASDDGFLIGSRCGIAYLDKDRIVLHDNKGQIMFYDTKGKPLTCIKKKGFGEDEYNYIADLIVDADREELFVRDWPKKNKIIVYDMSGWYKRTLSLPKERIFISVKDYDKDNLIAYMEYIVPEDEYFNSTPFMIISKEDGGIRKEFGIPYEEKIFPQIRSMDEKGSTSIAEWGKYPIKRTESGFLLTDVPADTIYRLESDYQLTPFIARTPSIQSQSPFVFLTAGANAERYQFMSTIVVEYDFEARTGFPLTPFVYDKKEHEIYRSALSNDDYPELNLSNIHSNRGIVLADETNVLFIQADSLLAASEKGQLKGELKDIASKLTEDDNPVLMVVHFK